MSERRALEVAMARTLGVPDVAFLLEAAGAGPTPVRTAARRALSTLPLDAEAAHRVREAGAEPRVPPGEPPPGPAVTEPAARELAGRVSRGVRYGRIPDDLAALGGLNDADVARLLTGLVHELLDTQSLPLERSARGLAAVLGALGPRGRGLGLAPPNPVRIADPRGRRAWIGGLCSLVHPAAVLRLAANAIAGGTDRRQVLELVADAAPLLAEPDPAAGARHPVDPAATALGQLIVMGMPTASAPARGAPSPGAPPPGVPTRGAPPLGTTAPRTEGPLPTRVVHARLDAADRVAPGAVLDLVVGLGDSPGRGVDGWGPMLVPTSAFDLTVTVMAQGFAFVSGDGWTGTDPSWTRELHASPGDPFPAALLRLRAPERPAQETCVVGAVYSRADAGLIGVANRTVRVTAASAPPTPEPDPEPSPPDVDWVLAPGDEHRPDLEIVITPGNTGPDRLLWHVRSPHPGLDRGGADATTVGTRVADVVKEMLLGIEERSGEAELGPYLRGLGRDIGDAVPPAVWATLAEAERTVGGAPTVLLATPEPYMPWELAREPGGADPEVLGARAVVGRWPYEVDRKSPSPAPTLAARSMAVVSGVYAGANRLEHAEAEALALRGRYGADDVAALADDIIRCLQGAPRAEILHFAVHGRFDASGLRDGVLLTDNTSLGRFSIRGARVDETGPATVRLVFLNACQLGQGREVFGRYAGMAQAFLQAGADAVLAPLWKVDDGVAQQVGEGFYRAVLERPAAPVSPAAFLRAQRRAAHGREDTAEGTRLAYVYFGHPSLRVRWEGQVHDG